ncbi:hypothetical protein BGX24_001888 [Mortierella sp. AD032]|nr:hypothetical protein BGX24_001888 [Mortierella sp. AD032]
MDLMAFSKGESVDATILLLAAEVGIAAMMNDLVTDTLGLSSTTTEKQQQRQLAALFESSVDIPGYGALFSPKIKQDLVTVLKHRAANTTTTENDEKTVGEIFTEIGFASSAKKFIYPPHQDNQTKVSILWEVGTVVCSREELTEALRIYTGQDPVVIFARLIDEVETTSQWRPRPAKTSRSRYALESNAQFSGLGQPFCTAVVEIALLMQDVPNRIVVKALQANVEQQSSEKMWKIHALFNSNSCCVVIQDAMYVCQYMTSCAKLN